MYRRWNEFQGAPNKYRKDSPHVTLSPKGVILMNSIAYDLFGAPTAVTLLYDRTNGVIGLKPADPKAPNAYPVKGKDNFRNHVIHGKPFFRHHELETDRTLTFNGVEAEEGIHVLDLATVTAVTKTKEAV